MKNRIWIAVVAIVAVVGVAFVAVNYQTDSTDTAQTVEIRVAANLPMTGVLATYGAAVRDGANMALEEMSDAGDSGSATITFDWQDNASDARSAVTIYQRQLLSDPTLYISGVKPQTMAIRDEVSSTGVPHFVWIFDANINPGTTNNFRTWVSYKIETPIYLEYIERREATRIAMVYVQLPHTVEQFEEMLLPALEAHGDKELFVEAYDFGRSDFRDIAVKVADFSPELIILNGFQNDLVGLIRSLRPLGAITDGNTIATYDLLDAANILGAEEIEGIRMVAPIFETRPETTTIAEWRDRFEAKYGREPLYTHAFAYDMVTAIQAAADSLTLPATNEDWVNALRAVDTDGVTGPIKFDSDGDMLTPLEVGVYREGVLVPNSDTD